MERVYSLRSPLCISVLHFSLSLIKCPTSFLLNNTCMFLQMNMILNECLRVYSPPTTLTRFTHNEANFGKYRIPAGVQLVLPVLAVHHDKKLWGDDATSFKPERFAEGVSKATQGQPKFIPFGSGPRVCIGQNFAMLEVKMAMVLILQNYSFKLSPSYSHAPHALITLQPQFGAHLILTKL